MPAISGRVRSSRERGRTAEQRYNDAFSAGGFDTAGREADRLDREATVRASRSTPPTKPVMSESVRSGVAEENRRKITALGGSTKPAPNRNTKSATTTGTKSGSVSPVDQAASRAAVKKTNRGQVNGPAYGKRNKEVQFHYERND